MSPRHGTEQLDRRSVDDLRERMWAGTPIVERRMSLGGVSTAVLEGGDGPPIVLLHSSGEFAALWMRVIPDLVTTHRVIAPDLPGHGASAGADGGLDVTRTLAWVIELIDRTCSSPPVLVGHALGGAIAARFAISHGDRLSRLVLFDAVGGEISSADLARIAVPTTLIWGRHDLQVPVRIAEAASARYGWSLHVIDEAGDDPAMERPEAFIEALRAGLTPLTRAEAGS